MKSLVAARWAFLIVVGAAPTALGAPTPLELSHARQLFAEATALEAKGEYAPAVPKLEAALLVKETPGLRYHLAYCQEQLGALVAALGNYERAAELIRNGAPAADVEKLLPAATRRLDSRLARLELSIPAGVQAGAELDGEELPLSAAVTTVKLAPGPHRLRVRSPGHADFNADLTFSSGEHRLVKVFFDSPAESAAVLAAVPAAESETTPTPVANERGGNGGRTVVLLGEAALALTGLGVGIGFSIARGNASDRIEQAQSAVDQASSAGTSSCGTSPTPAACADLDQALDDHARASTMASVGFIGAGVAAGALALTWALWPSSPKAVSLTLHPQAAGVGLLAGGAF